MRLFGFLRSTTVCTVLLAAPAFGQAGTTSKGDFGNEHTIPAGVSPVFVAAGDLNGDGKQDLVVVNQGDNTIGLYIGNGDGTFAAPVFYAAGVKPAEATIVDINGDSKPDVIVVNSNFNGPVSGNTFQVFLGNGDGTLQNPLATHTGSTPLSIAVADFDHDGKLDVVAANLGDGNVSLFKGNGDGTFQAPQAILTSGAPGIVRAADLNGDGNADLIVAECNNINFLDLSCSISPGLRTLLGNGDGTFGVARGVSDNQGLPFGHFQLADVNADGKVDVVRPGPDILFGAGDGTFSSELLIQRPVFPNSYVAVADFNGDGFADIVVSTGHGNQVPVAGPYVNSKNLFEFLGQTDGTFVQAAPYTRADSPLLALDLNGDGKPDIVTTDGDQIAIYLNVSAVTRAATTVQLSVDPNPAAIGPPLFGLGANVTLTMNVTAGANPRGALTVYSDGVEVQVSSPPIFTANTVTIHTVITSNAPCSCDIIGTHTLLAKYSGDSLTEAAASNAVNLELTRFVPTLFLISTSGNKSFISGLPFDLEVDIVGSGAFTGGTVSFFDNGQPFGDPVPTFVHSGHNVVLKDVGSLPPGTHVITATFSGVSLVAPATSNPFTLTVGATNGFAIALDHDSATVKAGQPAAFDLTFFQNPPIITAVFPTISSLTCSGLPAGSTCTFNPATFPIATAGTKTTVTITTTGATAALHPNSHPFGPGVTFLAFLCAGLVVVRDRTSGNRRLPISIALILLCLGCGGGSGGSSNSSLTGNGSSSGTPAGTSTVVITGVESQNGATFTQQTQVTLTVTR